MLITDKKQLENYKADRCLWVGIPSVEVTKKGRVFLTFYSGGTREEIGNFVLLVRSDDGKTFGDPIAACYADGYRCYDPCLWIDPLGRLWFTWSRCPEDGVFAAICDDPDAEELVFGEEFFVGNNVMMNKPTVLSTGEWLFPIAVWNENVRSLPEQFDSPITPKGSFAYVTTDCGKTFRKLGYADVKDRSFDEHQFLELKNGVVRCFVRTRHGIGAADSYDGGRHWGTGFDTGYGGPSSRFHIRRLPSGRVLLINHYDFHGRNNLTAMLSEDDGKTFPYRLLLDERRPVAYPDAALDSDGMIHITYDRERGAFLHSFQEVMSQAREILTAKISEEDILAGRLVDPESYLKNVAYKLTEYAGDPQNPFHESDLFSVQDYAGYLERVCKTPQDIITAVLEAYGINCTNIHYVQAQKLDALIEKYVADRNLDDLNQLIALVRSGSAQSAYAEDDIVNRVCRYIMDHPEDSEPVETIAGKFYISAHYLRHVFKRKTGTTIGTFRTEQRIRKAKLLLRTTGEKVTEIALACGYENGAYFTERFIKETGMTPTAYRKQKE